MALIMSTAMMQLVAMTMVVILMMQRWMEMAMGSVQASLLLRGTNGCFIHVLIAGATMLLFVWLMSMSHDRCFGCCCSR